MREEVAEKLLEKVRRDYDDIADEFSAARTELWPEMERFRALVKPGDRVLDVGCGNGRAYRLFQGMALEYEGLDVSEKLIRIARERVRDLLAQFRVGSMLALPYEDASFDAVFAVAVVHHIPSRACRLRALREAWRVLKPGGRVVMTNWDRLRPKYFRELAVATIGKLLGISPYDFGDIFIRWGAAGGVRRYYHVFTLRGLRRLCRDAGFVVDEAYRSDGNLFIVCRKPARGAAV